MPSPSPHPAIVDTKSKVCGQMRSGYFSKIAGYRVVSTLESYPVRSVNQCVAYCMVNPTCRSFNMKLQTSTVSGINAKMCELSTVKLASRGADKWRQNLTLVVADELSDLYYMTSLHHRQESHQVIMEELSCTCSFKYFQSVKTAKTSLCQYKARIYLSQSPGPG